MPSYDLIVIGGGTGNNVASAAARDGRDVALVERDTLGGTCLTKGCDPSKTLLHRAKLAEQVREADAFGIEAELAGIDFGRVIADSTEPFDEEAAEMAAEMREADDLAFYETEATFVDDHTLIVGDEELTAERIVVAVGARPTVPPIDGLDDVDYLTSDDALRLDERPDHLVVIGGGYVAAEMGYAYSALGAEVTVVSRSDPLLGDEDREVREAFTEAFAELVDLYPGYEATAVEAEGGTISVTAAAEEDEIEVAGDELLVAAGRRPNSDQLAVENTAIETGDEGYIVVDEHMETAVDGIYAFGDVVGEQPFWHAAMEEAEVVYHNAVHGEERAIDYPGMAHALFASPEVASTGATEDELEADGRDYAVGRYDYTDTAMGLAKQAEDGFVKVLADPDDGELLGCHIIGPDASTLIHEVTVATSAGNGTIGDVTDAIHVHPALNEVVSRAFEDV